MTVLTDRATDPAVLSDLRDVRLGQAYFSRKLNELRNAELLEPSRLAGWTRAHVIAHVGYNARGLNRLVDWAESGVPSPMYSSPDARASEISFGATLAPRALRHLSDHAAIALDVAWRDLPVERWSFVVRTAQGREVPVSETVWLRSREVWLHAIDLGNGGRFEDVPAHVARRLIGDVLTTWSSRDSIEYVLVDAATGEEFRAAGSTAQPAERIRATLPALLAWTTGRSRAGVTTGAGGPAPQAPRWL